MASSRPLPVPGPVPPPSTAAVPPLHLLGVDFTCAPGPRKPIVVARGVQEGPRLRLLQVQTLATLSAFETLLTEPGPWLGAFDFPFGLPRAFVESLGLGDTATAVAATLRARCATRMDFRALVDGWGNGRPPGQRLLHRATDTAVAGASSTSPLQTRYVPVGFMYYEGLPRLLQAGVHLPGLHAGDPQRVALEGYPGRLAFLLLGRRSYKNTDDAERLLARKEMVEALEQGRGLPGLRLKLTAAQAGELVADASGDRIDAVLCLVQAALAAMQPSWGLPSEVDAVEGWISGAVAPADGASVRVDAPAASPPPVSVPAPGPARKRPGARAIRPKG